MIGMVTKGGSFSHCIAYCLEDKRSLSEDQKMQLSEVEKLQHKNRAEVLDYHLCYGDKKELAEQMKDVRKLNNRVEKPVLHLSIRLAQGDHLTKAQWVDIGRAAAKEFGLAENQYLTILHKDTREQHIHVVGNRIGYDRKVASDSQNYRRMAALCRRLEKEYQLKTVLSPRRFQSQKERQAPRLDQRKERLKKDIREALQNTRTYPDFEKKIREKGYQVYKGRGIAFEDNKKVRTKGSEVGYSLQKIEQVLTQNEKIAHRQSSTYGADQTQGQEKASKKVPTSDKEQGRTSKLSQSDNHNQASVMGTLLKELLKAEPQHGAGDFGGDSEEEKRRKKRQKGLHH